MAHTADRLADAAATGMMQALEADPGLHGCTAEDVCNGALTLCNRMINTVLEGSQPELLVQNREGLKQALMSLLLNTTVGEQPKA